MVSKLYRNGGDDLAEVLQGRERIVSYPGTSQFSGGVSSCGLAAMNFARVLFELIRIYGERQTDVLRAITKKETIQEIISICSGWSSNLHLDIEEDIQRIPLFDKSLKLVSTRFGSPNAKFFGHILQDMQTLNASATVIITRPPEIIACTKIKGSGTDVFVIFDSHPRPIHPSGAGLILSTSIDQAAARLASILPPPDCRLLSQGGLQWQAQLLNNVSGHMFVSNGPPGDVREMQQSVIQSSLGFLRLQAEVKELKAEVGRLTSENEVLERDVQRLEDDLSVEKKKVTSLQASSKIRQSGHVAPISPHSTNMIAGPTRAAHLYATYTSSPPDKLVHGRGAHGTSSSSSNTLWGSPISDEWELESPTRATAFELRQSLDIEDMQLRNQRATAFELQRSFDVEDMQLRGQMQALAMTIPRSFSCTICMEEQPVDNSVELGCHHSICRVCLRGHICSKIEEHRYPILCPMCMTEQNDPQSGVISGVLVRQIGIDEQQYAIWEEMELSQLSVLIHCRKCQRSVCVDKQEHEESRMLVCPLPDCNHIWCKACQQPFTIGGPSHSCDGTSELDHLMKERGWKYCPNCKTPVQRDGGCNHMTCIAPGCNSHFCDVCGKLIVRSALQSEIKGAVSAHYSACRLFEG